ncbi:MAG: hypothetical protein ACO1SV_12710 [Fimbriimonas sp.]
MKLPLAILAFASVALSAAQQAAPVDRDAYARKMNAMTAKEWRPGVGFGDQLAELPSPIGFEILRDNWSKGASVEARQQMFKGFVFNNHPDTLRVLNLGATDPDLQMQKWAFTYLKKYAFIDFSEDYRGYKDWFAKYGNRSLKAVVQENAVRFISDVRNVEGAARDHKLEMLNSGGIVEGVSVPSALDLAREILNDGRASQAEARAVRTLLQMATPSETYYRQTVLPAIRSGNSEIASTALDAMGKAPVAWATDELLKFLKEIIVDGEKVQRYGFTIGMALGERKDPRAVPTVIAAIEAHNEYDTVYGLGYFALAPITGVSYGGTHDGAWWKEWWASNRTRFPAEMQKVEIPALPRSRKVKE